MRLPLAAAPMPDAYTVPLATPFADALNRAPPHVPLVIATRGGASESVHYGSVAVVDRTGTLLYAAGDPQFLTMTRSALKPFQAIPFVASGGKERFGYSAAKLALMCASHSGEPRQVAAVADMLAKSGSTVGELQCGTHAPGYFEVRGEIPPPPPWSPLAHNCSGKHSGMLAYCVHCALPKQTYLAPDHPLQQTIRRCVAHFTGIAESDLVTGIDGCSAPNYGVPLAALARAYARLASEREDALYGLAPRILADAMTAHPEMVSGEGRNDLALMRAGRGDWVTKIGAEGVQAIGIRGAGLGIAIKVADGAKRGLHPATVAVLDQLGLLDDHRRAELAPWREPTIRNYRGIATGAVRPVVVMDKLEGAKPACRADSVALGSR
jgi:L-asparaginase II